LPGAGWFGVPGVFMATSYAGDWTPLSARAVISFGAQIEELAATRATKAVANNIVPWAFWTHSREWLTGNLRTRGNLDNGAISDIATGDPNRLREVSGRTDIEPLAQARAPVTTSAYVCAGIHKGSDDDAERLS
jgi:hypothetical protein